jgi:hypothetical protein
MSLKPVVVRLVNERARVQRARRTTYTVLLLETAVPPPTPTLQLTEPYRLSVTFIQSTSDK